MIRPALLLACVGAAIAPGRASAQMVTIGTPFHSVGDSFYERFGTSWSARGPGFFASFNGGNTAPPFGGYNPNSGINGGFSLGGGPFSSQFNFSAAQGASRTMTSVTPSVTTLNGYPGFFTDSVQRPFVTGVVPVVGVGAVGYMPIVSGLPVQPQLAPLAAELPWREKLATQGLPPRATRADDEEPPANRGAAGNDGRDGLVDALPPTKAERERQQEAEEAARNNAAHGYYDKGLAALEKGKPSVARLYFEMAAKRATGPLKAELEERLQRR